MKLTRIPPPGKSRKNSKSAWLAAVDAAGGGGIRYPPQIGGRWNYPIVRITCANLSSQAALEGGYGGAFGKVNSNEKCHLIDISVSVPSLGKDGDGDVVFGRQVVGALKTNDKSGSLSYAIAQATLGAATNTLSVQTSGLADSATAAIRQMAGQTLTAESSKNFGEGIGNCLSWVVDNATRTTPAARPAPLFQPAPEYSENSSLCLPWARLPRATRLTTLLAFWTTVIFTPALGRPIRE